MLAGLLALAPLFPRFSLALSRFSVAAPDFSSFLPVLLLLSEKSAFAVHFRGLLAIAFGSLLRIVLAIRPYSGKDVILQIRQKKVYYIFFRHFFIKEKLEFIFYSVYSFCFIHIFLHFLPFLELF